MPFFLGDPVQPVYGVFHPPAGTQVRRFGVVLCHAFGHEYIRSHRIVRALAARLAREGVPTLRFDYTGTGDSAGDATTQSVDQWHADIASAIEEVRDMAAVGQVVLVGLRLGAAVACTCPPDSTMKGLILWDPVVNGGRYTSELADLHADFVQHHHPRTAGPPGGREFLGQRFNGRLWAGIESTDLMTLERPPAPQISIVASEPRDEYSDFRDYLIQLGGDCTLECIPDPAGWRSAEHIGEAVLAPRIVTRIVSLVTGDD